MRSNWHRALLVSFVLIMSSLAGCIGTDDDDELEEGQYGTVMVSTYHVGEIVKAIAGDTVNVQMMSQNNIPVHDYSPALEDIVRLGDADLFLYHGLGLEPWVESTLEGLGSEAPAYGMVHTMPTGEISLDYETMLVDKLCDSLSSPSATVIHMLAEHAEDAEELHGDDGAHNLGFPEDDRDDHGDDDHDDHDEHDEDREDHDGHDEHDHSDHEMLMPEDRLEASSDCPTGTVISVYHFEAGEYMLEFEGEDVETFMMAIAAMGGAHHHHDHGDHDDHGDDDHDDHDDHDEDHGDHDDHDNHDEDEMVCYDISTHTIDSSITTEEDCDAAGLMWVAANSGPGGDDDHGEHDEDEMHAEDVMALFDSNNDGYLSLEEFMEGVESMEDDHDDHDHHDDNSNYYDDCIVNASSIDPNDGYYECWMNDWRDEEGNLTNTDGYDEDECTELSNSTWECEHHEDDDEEHHVCHNTLTHANTNDSEDSCGAYTYFENHTMGNQTFTGCYNTMTHQVTWDNESACGAYVWMDPADHGHDDHDFEHEFEEALFGHYFNEADADGDGLLDMTELETLADTMNNMEGDLEMDLMIEIYMIVFDEDEDGVLSVGEFTEMMEMMMSMDEEGHDDHDDHDHGDEDEMVCYDISTHTVDHSITNQADCEAAGLMWVAANSGPGGDDDHDDDHGDEMNMTAMAEMMFAMFDANEDGSLDESEVHTMFEEITGMEGDDHEEDVAFIGLHIEEEGEYGIALPAGVELHVLMAGGHEGHDHGSHDDHDDHAGHDDHDDHGDEDDHDDHGEEELAYDPHSWLDPVAMAAQADVVLAKLIEVFPDGEDVFTDNANAFKVELATLDDKFKTLTSTCTDRTVAANHNAYSYLAYRYDIEFVTVHGLDPEGEPSAEDVVKVVDHIQEEGITVLFVEEYTDQSSIKSIVDETGVSIQTLYTMEMAPSDSSDDYLSLMNKNFESLEAGMSCSA